MADGGPHRRVLARVVGSSRDRRVAVAWIAVVLAASVVDPSAADASGGFPDVVYAFSVSVYTLSVDIYALSHIIAYGVLAWLVAAGIDGGDSAERTRPVGTVLVAAALASAVGLGVEFIQAPLAARTASAADAVVNGIGAVAGAGARALVRGAWRNASEGNTRG
jgi:VanZ family protein